MQIGAIALWENDIGAFRSRLERAEALGYSVIGVGDSATMYRDLYVSMTIAAEATKRATIASMVTIPAGRDPVLVASALSSLDELTGGRIVCCVGTGGSATAALGRGAIPLREVAPYCDAVRRLLSGESIKWDGLSVPALRHPRPVPLYLSAYGPAARRLAGRSFDGVLLAAGASVRLATAYIGEVCDAAVAAGRDPASVNVWMMTRGAVRDDRQTALDDIKANLASAARFGLHSEAQLATVPAELHTALRQLNQRYDVTQHVVWDGPNASLVDELGLTEYLAGRFAIAGTPAECHAQIAALEDTPVSAVIVPAVDRDPEGLLERFIAAAGRSAA
jgi:alkanesulfonate monooxygenase SsuD/methylene tetrahydromethanopterin reductase-like flavin-dependent oxidoreductase (luciferase family)